MTVMAGTCSRCASGNHSSHMVSLGGICIGCACTVKVRGEDPPVEKRVDTLLRAAEKSRALAAGATSGPWFAVASGVEGAGTVFHDAHVLHNDADHIAAMDPMVGHALADLFEEFARLDDQGIHPPTSIVTLAKHYLGEA